MNRFSMYFFAVVAGIMLAGCAGLSGNEIQVIESRQPGPDAAKAKFRATARIGAFVDGRNAGNPRKIGIAKERVLGLSGTDLVLDRDATDVVSASLRKRLDDSNIQMLASDDGTAQFEIGGVIKALEYNVKDRDYVTIMLETTLKEVATGKVVWMGEVEQKNERFAGVSGNSKSDIANFLKQELGVVTGKTAEAIASVLMAKYPELFNLVPGTKVIPGVTVYSVPGNVPPVPTTPTARSPVVSDLQPEGLPFEDALLIVRTEPVGAKIYLDGVYYGISPLHARAPLGIHKVEARLKGYRVSTEKVALRKGDTTELEMELEK
ncbi:MAG: PEGA domain-containing protein [Gallionella sp.]|nr:PEGA domain-containing protein [Gallionella sp.]